MKLKSSLCCSWLVLGVMLQEVTTEDPEGCKDDPNMSNCANFPSEGLCERDGGNYAHYCRKTCGLCEVEPTTTTTRPVTTTTTHSVTTATPITLPPTSKTTTKAAPVCIYGCIYGRCINGWCSCTQGYEGINCNSKIPVCSPKCQHGGTCNNGQCICGPVWEGPTCAKRKCTPLCKNGECNNAGICVCGPKWEGKDCGKRKCTPSCKNGECNNAGICVCGPSWAGKDCGKRKCTPSCKNGECNNAGICVCEPGWTGEDCGTKICTPSCKNGECNNAGICVCGPGWTGEDCGTKMCSLISGYVEVKDVMGGGPTKCFRFTKEKGDYQTHKLRCKMDGMSAGLDTRLATGLDIGDWVLNIKYYIGQHYDLQDEAFFTDGTDEGHEGLWTWTDPKVGPIDMNRKYWGPGQPDQGKSANQLCLYTPDFLFNTCKASANIKGLCMF